MNEGLTIAVVVFLVGVAIAVAIGVNLHQVHGHNEAMRRLAKSLGGRLSEADLFHSPTLWFHHHGAPGRLDYYTTGGKHPTWYTQLHLAWPDAAFRCEVYPEGFFHRVGKLFGLEDREIGYAQFDAEYVVAGHDLPRLREVLNPAVQQILNSLRRLGSGDVYLSIQGGRMLLKLRGRLRDWDSLAHFTRLGLLLYDESHTVEQQGIEFLESPAAEAAVERVICQVCGEGIGEERVLCRRCRTPHHQDCWEYYGACSVYGCGETRYKSAGAPAAGSHQRFNRKP